MSGEALYTSRDAGSLIEEIRDAFYERSSELFVRGGHTLFVESDRAMVTDVHVHGPFIPFVVRTFARSFHSAYLNLRTEISKKKLEHVLREDSGLS